MKIEDIARICHEANKTLCITQNDFSQKSWDEAEEWQRSAAIQGVKFALANPDAPASASHDDWLKDKINNGWVYGEVKDAGKKTHPSILPYDQLSAEEQAKDYLFKGIVNALSKFVER